MATKVPPGLLQENREIKDELYALLKNAPARDVYDRFMAKVKVTDWMSCWLWQGGARTPYGVFWLNRKNISTHRVIVDWTYGYLKDHDFVDHIVCNTPLCVNPLHLIPTTPKGNVIRPGSRSTAYANALKTHCHKGHPLEGENLRVSNGLRQCRVCAIFRKRGYRRAQGKPARPKGYTDLNAILGVT